MKKVLFQLSMAFLLFACSSPPTESSALEGGPFAVLRFKVSGCMSCSHCRSVIRQAERGAGEGRLLSVGDEEAELKLLQPGPIDIKAETERLLTSGIIRFKVHEVELETHGSTRDGKFVVAETSQEFQLESPLPDDSNIRNFRANVTGWDGASSVRLHLCDPELTQQGSPEGE